jgi:DNA recombination protein RmuC
MIYLFISSIFIILVFGAYFIKSYAQMSGNSNKINESINFLDKEIKDILQRGREETLSGILKVGHSFNDSIEKIRDKIESRLDIIQKSNSEHLDKIRNTVDEKLESTLEKRLASSFKLVSDRLEVVHKGLGDMQNLAKGVGDLKQVLTNVKLRGTWGEVQLSGILQQMMFPGQYIENAVIKDSNRVEFAIRMPANDLLLPIDSKFPIEDYKKICDVETKEDKIVLQNSLETRIKNEAKNIASKYIDPPKTTDFAILFLPTEVLYSEILKIPGLLEFIQNKYRVVVAGPWTLAAILNGLQLGFKSLAIQKRSSEVWNILVSVKTEFSKFGALLEKTHKKLLEAGNVIESAAKKSRTLEKKLGTAEDNQHQFVEKEIL